MGKVDVIKIEPVANNVAVKRVKREVKRECPMLDKLYTVEECVLTRGRQGKTKKVGNVYVHMGFKDGTLRLGGTEHHYKDRQNDADKKHYPNTDPILILLCDDIAAVEYSLHRTLNTKNSHVYPKKGETFADMYQRVIHAFLFYDILCRKRLTSYFHRLVSLQHIDDWAANRFVLRSNSGLYLNNNTHNEELVEDTHIHVGLDNYFDDKYPKHRYFQQYLKLPVHMRKNAHKDTLWQGYEDVKELKKIYATIEKLSSIY